jgi:hypothetical protein
MKEAMKLGILITIFATTLYAVLWAIINYFFIPDFADRFADHTIEYNRYLGKSPETMRKKIIEMNEYRVNYNGYSKLSVLNDEKKKIIRMNFNVVGQLISTFFIVSIGPAIIAYLAYKKAL